MHKSANKPNETYLGNSHSTAGILFIFANFLLVEAIVGLKAPTVAIRGYRRKAGCWNYFILKVPWKGAKPKTKFKRQPEA